MIANRRTLKPIFLSLLSLSLLLATTTLAQGTSQSKTPAKASTKSTSAQTGSVANLNKQRESIDKQLRPDIESQRNADEQQAKKDLDQDAIATIKETRTALEAIAANKTDQALAAIERATGKINILLARKPATGLLPVAAEVDVIDTAPPDSKMVNTVADAASRAVRDHDYPKARVLLDSLVSEIRVRTYNLPLATYPDALKNAAQLLDQKKTQEASAVLLGALNTLAVVDRVTPIPLIRAREAVAQAQKQESKNKDAARQQLETAKNQLQRAKDLGYAGQDPEYAALNNEISNLEKQIGNGDLNAVLAKLKDRVESFVKRQSEQEQKH
jgi:uncharacterized protein YpmS